MGPLPFNIFINDNVEVNSLFELIIYTDDTTLVSTLESLANLKQIMVNLNVEIY